MYLHFFRIFRRILGIPLRKGLLEEGQIQILNEHNKLYLKINMEWVMSNMIKLDPQKCKILSFMSIH